MPIVFVPMAVTNKTQEPGQCTLLRQHVVKMPTLPFCQSVLKSIATHIKTTRIFDVTHRGADKSLARPGRKQANVSLRIA